MRTTPQSGMSLATGATLKLSKRPPTRGYEMARFFELHRHRDKSPILVQPQYIESIYTDGEGHVWVDFIGVGDEAVDESYDEIKALLSLTGHEVEDRSATQIVRDCEQDAARDLNR